MSHFGLLRAPVHHPESLDKQIFTHFKIVREYFCFLCGSEENELLEELSLENLHWMGLRIFTYVHLDLF